MINGLTRVVVSDDTIIDLGLKLKRDGLDFLTYGGIKRFVYYISVEMMRHANQAYDEFDAFSIND